jgi:hypothetical protein
MRFMRIRLFLLAGVCLAAHSGLIGAAQEPPKNLEIVADGRTLRPASEAEATELRRLIALGKENAESFNTLNASGAAPLHKAAQFGRVAVVEYLLDHGATAKDGSKQTALELLDKAAEDGIGGFANDPKRTKERIEASLLKHGAIRRPSGGAAPAASVRPGGEI